MLTPAPAPWPSPVFRSFLAGRGRSLSLATPRGPGLTPQHPAARDGPPAPGGAVKLSAIEQTEGCDEARSGRRAGRSGVHGRRFLASPAAPGHEVGGRVAPCAVR